MGIFYVYSQFGSLFHIINLKLTAILGPGFSTQYILNDHTHSIREIRFLAICPGWWVELSSLPLKNRRVMAKPRFYRQISSRSHTAEACDYTALAGWEQDSSESVQPLICPQMSAVHLTVFPKHRDFMATLRSSSEKDTFLDKIMWSGCSHLCIPSP